MNYLERLLALANENSVPVALVEMPLTKENYALLPEDIKAQYKERIKALSDKYKAKLIVPGNSLTFARGDFEDSVHLNARGGNKLFSYIAKEIAADEKLACCRSWRGTKLGLGNGAAAF